MGPVHAVEYHSAVKRKEILPFAAPWIYLEDIMLTKISQKDRYVSHMTSYVKRKRVELKEIENRTVVTRYCRDGGNGEMLVQGNKLSVIRGVCSGNLMYSMVTKIKMYYILEIC